MSSPHSAENLTEMPQEATEEVKVQADDEQNEDSQQVDSIRIARLSRALARLAGGLSETPHRVGNNA
jgi:hypothetical protein